MKNVEQAASLYPTPEEKLKELALLLVRGPLIATVLAYTLQPAYHYLATHWQYSDVGFVLCGTMLIHALLYYGIGSFFLCCDRFGWFPQYKMPRSFRMEPTRSLLRSTLLHAFFDQAIAQPIGLYLLLTYVTGAAARNEELGAVWKVFGQFSLALLWNEGFFYAVHRTLHEWPQLYKRIHKQHHQYVGTVGFAAEHAHPLERLLANDFPTAGFCLLFKVHPLIWFVWLAWRLEETYETHSGYCFLRSPLGRCGLLNGRQAEFHDFHHSINMGNYGHHALDAIFHTMDQWLIATQLDGARPKTKKQKRGIPASENKAAPSYLQDPQKILQLHESYTCCSKK